jgi:hypothetical protein
LGNSVARAGEPDPTETNDDSSAQMLAIIIATLLMDIS